MEAVGFKHMTPGGGTGLGLSVGKFREKAKALHALSFKILTITSVPSKASQVLSPPSGGIPWMQGGEGEIIAQVTG